MRLLEAIGTAGFVLYAGHLLYRSSDWEEHFALLLYASALIIVCHAWLEGCRWQMTPTYFLAIGFALHECAHLLWGSNISAPVGLVAFALTLASIFLCTVMPVFKLPAPTGPYKLGTQTRHIIDDSRHDPLLGASHVGRELVIQIWYPADPLLLGQKSAPYRDRRITSVKDAHLALVKTHSILGARLLPSTFQLPVLLYTPSWSGIRTECTTMAEELASHGYVVVGIDHPFSSRVVAFPDGRIARRKFAGDEDYSSEASVEKFVKTADEQVRLRAKDAQFVLNRLQCLNRSDPDGLLTGRLNLDRIGIFGFSLGGGTAAEACYTDLRFKAGLNMGGMIAADALAQGTLAPFFFMFEGLYESAPYTPEADIHSLGLRRRREVEFARKQFERMKRSLTQSGGYWMTMDGIRHMDFSDSPFFSPLRHGPARPKRVTQILRRYALAFFDEQLKGIGQSLLDGRSSDVSGMRFQAWRLKSRTPRQAQNIG